MAETEAPGLGEVREPVRIAADVHAREQRAGGRIDHRYGAAKAVAGPQFTPVRRYLHHVRAPADRPEGSDLTRREIDDRNRARQPIAHIREAGVPTDLEAVGSFAGGDEGDLEHAFPVDHRDP